MDYSTPHFRPNSSASTDSNAAGFWDERLSSRIDPIGTAQPPGQYSSATTSSAEALDEKERILRDAINPIISRCCDEERALESILRKLREHRECQEHTLGSSLSIINQHRNLLTPVARLPPEILSRILVLNAQPVHRDWRVDAAKAEPEWWVDVARTSSQVCRRWRQVALDCPEIWSYISFKRQSQRWIAEMIERSHSAPLSLFGGHRVKWNEALMGLVADNMHRFEYIDLWVNDKVGYYTESLFKMLSKSAPTLEYLTLAVEYYSGRACVNPAFPREFLSGCTPNLRHLKVSASNPIQWDSGIFTNLTTLSVTRGRGCKPGLSSFEMLITALTRMPGLELLTLCQCIPHPAHPTARCDHANLPNLKRLELTEPLNHCTDLLRQIAVSASTTLLLNLASDRDITKEDVDRFEEVFPLHPWGACNSRIGVWPARWGSVVTGSENTRTPLAIAWARFITLVSPQLRSSCIPNITGWDVDCWRGFAHVAPELQSLTVGGEAQVVELGKALRPPNGPNVVPADCCFPVLSHLELVADYNPRTDISAWGEEEAQLSTMLTRILAERAEIGCSTPKLVFSPRPWSDKRFPDDLSVMWTRRASQGLRGAHASDASHKVGLVSVGSNAADAGAGRSRARLQQL
ncbi:hypothetical protein BD779DRAFT_1717720 [Infundibulicybe gibba]|nr:hypothetical protein BD779DRAFT_1717720 [Infundibulicybe gibba]